MEHEVLAGKLVNLCIHTVLYISVKSRKSSGPSNSVEIWRMCWGMLIKDLVNVFATCAITMH